MAIRRVYLACSGGFSTSVLVQRVNSMIREKGLELEVEFISDQALGGIPADTLLVLLAPQVAFRMLSVKESLPSPDIPLELIDRVAYGRADADAVLSQIESHLSERE